MKSSSPCLLRDALFEGRAGSHKIGAQFPAAPDASRYATTVGKMQIQGVWA
jgi:hypothetical protein